MPGGDVGFLIFEHIPATLLDFIQEHPGGLAFPEARGLHETTAFAPREAAGSSGVGWGKSDLGAAAVWILGRSPAPWPELQLNATIECRAFLDESSARALRACVYLSIIIIYDARCDPAS